METKWWTGNVLSSLKTSVIVTGSIAIIFVAFRNTLTWHIQQFSADFWVASWVNVLAFFRRIFGEENFECNLFIYGTYLVTVLAYWLISAVYIFFDVTGKPEFIRKYKIQPGTNEPVNTKQLFKVIFWVLFNQTVMSVPFLMAFFPLMKFRGYTWGTDLPSFNQVLIELIVMILIEEVGFYYTHRLGHHRLFYKRFHKMHHEFTSPIGPAALYAHPLEHIVTGLMPMFTGILVVGCHLATMWLWLLLGTLSIINSHSGYHLPFFPSPEAHDFHHLKFINNYGVLGVLDRLHGTDAQFRETYHYARHYMLLSMAPAAPVK